MAAAAAPEPPLPTPPPLTVQRSNSFRPPAAPPDYRGGTRCERCKRFFLASEGFYLTSARPFLQEDEVETKDDESDTPPVSDGFDPPPSMAEDAAAGPSLKHRYCVECLAQCDQVHGLAPEDYEHMADQLDSDLRQDDRWNRVLYPVGGVGSAQTAPEEGKEGDLPAQPGDVRVVMFSGESCLIDFDSIHTMTVGQLKQRIANSSLKIPANKQRLVFSGRTLSNNEQTLAQAGCHGTLAASTSGEPARLQLVMSLIMEMLQVGPSGSQVEHLMFALEWGFPDGKEADFLDGTCLLYNDKTYVGLVDYQNCECRGVTHSGDDMSDAITARIGKHRMEANLRGIPDTVNHLFFVLSAFHCDRLSAFKRPTVRLYDKEKPDQQLCEYAISSAGDSEAAVMCYAKRWETGAWTVEALGKTSAGSAKNYSPLRETCVELLTALGSA